jgi:hypothetical protein
MPGSTTIAETLNHVFAKLEQSIPSQNTPDTLLQAWTHVFGGPGRSALDVVVTIGHVSSILIKLEAQINASTRLADFQKRSAPHPIWLHSAVSG